MTNWKARCAELLQAIDDDVFDVADGPRFQAAIDRTRAELAQPEGEGLTVNLQIDVSPECLKRLCDGLAAAVKPDGGYKAATTDDPAPGTGCDQMVQVEWWVPQHGCDSLENTLDAIKGRLLAAVRDWWATALVPTTPNIRAALAQPEPVALTVQECNDMRKHRENYIYEYCDGNIELDGCFSREDLLELARTMPIHNGMGMNSNSTALAQPEGEGPIAAALRAAADQVVPVTPRPNDTFCCPPVASIVWQRVAKIRAEFLAIAAELEEEANG